MMKNEFSKLNITWEIAFHKAKDDTKWNEIIKQLRILHTFNTHVQYS